MGEIPRLQVSEFIQLVNQTLESAYPFVKLEGEISDLRVNSKNPFINFTLKDDEASLSCSIIKYKLDTPIEEGMSVILEGKPDIYAKSGWFKFNAQKVTPNGEGALQRAFEMLKKQLEKEGLFDESRKREIPRFPEKIGIISSDQAAGYSDFLKILGERWGGLKLQFVNVQVQGEPAPRQIIEAIDYFNQASSPPEVLVLIRGGGSLEDLHAFNSETVARAVAGSRVPVVVGVGHERDITLAGLVADKRASTPTNAAEITVPKREDIFRAIEEQKNRISRALENTIKVHLQNIDYLISKIENKISIPLDYVDNLKDRLNVQIHRLLEMTNFKTNSLVRALKAYDPELALKRGYSLARKGDEIIMDSTQVKIGEIIMLQLAKGSLKTKVEDVQK